jgi:hypothetical protein
MARRLIPVTLGCTEGGAMNVGLIVVMLYVVGVLAVVAFALFALSPFAHHRDVYHERGERQASPRLD